jgi:hypothetical protein
MASYLADLRSIKPDVDSLAYTRAKREIPIAIEEGDEAAIHVKVAENTLARARQEARAAIQDARREGRQTRITKALARSTALR